MLKVLGS